MKRTRIFMLGFGLALFAGAMSAEPAVAQCWDCQFGNFPGSECANCVAGQFGIGAEDCATPECTDCVLGGRLCMVFTMLDGRAAPADQSDALPSVASIDLHAFTAPYGSSHSIVTPRRTSEAHSRSCDGSIVSRRYTPIQVSALRSETAQLRL